MKYKHLHINEAEGYAVLLGYKMPLTASEFKILFILTPHIIEYKEGMSTSDLMTSFSDKDIRNSNITVHICSINKKAKEIGGRRLITFTNGKYFLNDCM